LDDVSSILTNYQMLYSLLQQKKWHTKKLAVKARDVLKTALDVASTANGITILQFTMVLEGSVFRLYALRRRIIAITREAGAGNMVSYGIGALQEFLEVLSADPDRDIELTVDEVTLDKEMVEQSPAITISVKSYASSVQKSYRLKPGDYLIGRDNGCDIVVADPYISKVHAKIFYRDGKWYIVDLGSTNGTYVSGEDIRALGPLVLKNGMKIVLGLSTITVEEIEKTFIC